jgi:hypothetical protein
LISVDANLNSFATVRTSNCFDVFAFRNLAAALISLNFASLSTGVALRIDWNCAREIDALVLAWAATL